jgi:ATP-binding cassette, subfamily C, bacterial CydCD
MSRFFDSRLLQHAQAERPLLSLSVVFGAGVAAFIVFQAFSLSRAVDAVFLRGAGLKDIAPWLIGLGLLSLGRAAAGWGSEVAAGRAARRVKADLRQELTAHILSLGPAYSRGERTGELVNTAVEGIEALDAYLSQYLPQLALAALMPLIFLAFIIPLDPLSGLVLLVTAPLIPVFMMLIGNLADGLARRQWLALSRMSSHFLDVLQGLTTLKLFDRSREQIEIIRAISNRHRDATLEVLRVAFLSALVLEMVGTLGTAIVAVEIGLRLLAGRMAFQQAFFVLILAPEFYLPLRLLGTRFHAATVGIAAARRIFEVLDAGSEAVASPSPALRERGIEGVRGGVSVSFRDVSYTYVGREVPSLDRVTFDIAPGEKIAMVGATGAGKSTAASLLLRFLQPSAGDIAVDGQPLTDLPDGDWRGLVAWVPQLPYLFDGTVLDNIRLGRPDASLAAVEQAVRDAAAAEFIAALPDGYATRIGERGARLSGGQAQRIALARAFLLEAPLVVLDEATANLDAETEATIDAALDRLLIGRAALIIAHRLHTVRRADRIVVLSGGRVAETGTHDELLAARGEYWRLVSASLPAIDTEIIERPERRRGGTDEAGSTTSESKDAGLHERGQYPSTAVPAQAGAPACAGTAAQDASAVYDGNSPRELPAVRVLLALLRFVAPCWRYVALSVVLGFLTIASSVGLLSVSAWLIASAALQPSIAALQVAIVGVRFFGISRGVARYFERLASHQVTFRVLAGIRAWFYAAIEPLSPVRLAAYTSGDLLSRIVGDIATLENFYVRAVAPPLVALLMLVALGLFFAAYSSAVSLALIIFLLIAGAVVPLLAQRMSRGPGRHLAEARAALSAVLVDAVQGAADLRAFGAAGRQVDCVAAAGAALAAAQGRMLAISSLTTGTGTVLTWLAVTAVLVVATPLVVAGRVPGVDLAVLALATLAGFEAVLPLPQAGQYTEASIAAGRRLLALAEINPRSTGRDGETLPRRLVRTGAGARMELAWPRLYTAPGIDIEHLTIRYEPGAAPALDDVSLSIPPGGRVAIVGPSGAGKTSLANALLRFVEPEVGALRVGGVDLAALAPEAARRMAGVVSQSTYLFNTTVAENLRLARPGASQAELEQAARSAQVHDFVAALPEGYATWVGDQGLRLSGGERQRLAIARAILRDAPILILDEPTANLDAATEAAVMAALHSLMPGKTTLLITHRLAGLEGMDHIVLLDRGRVVEQGTHAELLRRGGLYRRLWERQRRIW